MGTARKVARNTVILVTGNTSIRAISFVVAIYLARYLSVEGYGKYSFVTAYVSLFAILANLGIGQILTREISKRPAESPVLVGSSMSLCAVLSAVSITVSLGIMRIAGYPDEIQMYVLVLSGTLLLDSLSICLSSIFRAALRMEFRVLSGLVDRILSFVGILWVLLSRGNLVEVFLVVTLSRLVAFSVTYASARRFVKPKLRVDAATWRYFLWESWPIALLSGFAVIYVRIDRVMLQVMRGDAAVGYYSVAYKLIETLQVVPLAFQYSLFPVLSVYYEKSRVLFEKTYGMSLRFVTMFAFLMAILGTYFSSPVISLLFGEKYSPATAAAVTLLWATIFIFPVGIFNRIVIASGKQVLLIFLSGIAAAVNIALNLVLIPVLGLVGAALATLVSYACIPMFGLLSKSLRPYSRTSIILIGKSLVAASPLAVLSQVLSLALAVILTVPAYLAILLVTRCLTPGDVSYLRRVLSKK